MPVRGGLLGPKAPQPAATTMALLEMVVPVDVRTVNGARLTLKRNDLLVQVEHRVERVCLFFEPCDQGFGLDLGITRDVVDGFFRVERGALAADGVERVNDMAAHVEHAGLEDLKQAHGPCSNDHNVGLVRLAHELSQPLPC